MASNAFNWFYDWSVIVKNDAYYTVEVRQYNSQSIPETIPWKRYDPIFPIPFLNLTTDGSLRGHWSFAVNHPTQSVYDLSGNQATLVNAKTSIEPNNLWVSRRDNTVILGGGSSGYNLTVNSSNSALAINDASFSWETYIYGIDANKTASYLSFIRTGSAGQGYAIEFDFVGKYLRFTVGSASISGIVTASIDSLLLESGFPPNYHYFGGTFIKNSGLFLYIDGVQVGFTSYTGGVVSSSVPFTVRNGQNMFVDEFVLYTGILTENQARYNYELTKERLRYLGMPSGSYYPYHQARFRIFASGSNEFELHQFSLRGLQNTSASIFDPRTTNLYNLPIFIGSSGSSGQQISGDIVGS
jgi:hypothetical protein